MMRFILGCLLTAVFSIAALAESRQIEIEIGGKVALADLTVPDGKTLADGVLVLAHGTLAHKDMELIEALQGLMAERGVATLAPSLTFGLDRRTGMYDCAVPSVHRHEDAVTEIAAWVGWLRGQGAKTISMFGHSRGGNQAATYSAGNKAIGKLVLLAPAMGRSANEHAAGFKRRFKTDLAPLMAKADELIKAGRGDELIDVPGFIYCPAGKASAASLKSYYGGAPEQLTLSQLGKVAAPVLVIAGSADQVVPDVPAKIGKIADDDKVTLKIIDDAGHMFLDFYAEDAADLIADFLTQ
ncbi:MAG: alpha/beta hydrolase [Rhizobiales bacterium]|nr:alpha/beta hydrolase [Hyphomicrobiales bacterium]